MSKKGQDIKLAKIGVARLIKSKVRWRNKYWGKSIQQRLVFGTLFEKNQLKLTSKTRFMNRQIVKNLYQTPQLAPIQELERRADVSIYRQGKAASIREARDWCKRGKIRVDGQIIKPGVELKPGQLLRVDKEQWNKMAKSVIIDRIMNKPKKTQSRIRAKIRFLGGVAPSSERVKRNLANSSTYGLILGESKKNMIRLPIRVNRRYL